MHERAPVSQDTSLKTLTTKPSNSPHRIEPVSSTCVPEGETGKSTCKLCYSFIPAPFLLALFSPKLFYNNWRCEEKAGRGLPLENFGVKTEEMEQVCVFSFICCFLMYFRSLISLSVQNSTALYLFIYPIYFTLFCLYLQ